ncbi:MAG: DUF2510 domain-containing protein [Actinomycetota bacterium]|nr:DUF2510 domain-containing protein [Actinomycetota bacterium]
MRKFLLWLGTVWVGMATIVAVFSTMIAASGSGGTGADDVSTGGVLFSGLVLWLFALAGGLALSAPAFLRPPDGGGGIWSFSLPLPIWMFLLLLKLASWVGFYVLLGVWMLIFRFWNNRQGNQLPSFAGAPQQFAGPQPYAPQGFTPQPFRPQAYPAQGYAPAAGLPAAGWHPDPTGRHRHRWWDGLRWTDRVGDGRTQGTDPM